MKSFFVAFRAYQKTTQLYSDLSGRLYVDKSPQSAIFPYGIWSYPSGVHFEDLEGNDEENETIQLDLYSKTLSEVLDLFDSADGSFNDCEFNIPGYQLISFKRVAQRRIIEDGIRRYIIEFSIKIGEE